MVFIVSSLVITSCVLGACHFRADGGPDTGAPPDRRLIAVFHDHRAEFEQLQRMAFEDSSDQGYFSASHLGERLDPTRKDLYRKLISQIDPDLAITTDRNNLIVRFVFASAGTAISPGWMKGLEYSGEDRKRQGEIVASLDNANTLPPGVYLRWVEPHWFIIYQRTDD